MVEHLAGGVGRRLWVRRRYPRRRQGNLARRQRGSVGELFWASGGGGELERGTASLAAAAPKGGRRGVGRFFWGRVCLARWPGALFPPCRELPVLPIGSCHAWAGAGAPAVYLDSRARRYVFGATGDTPIWALSPKSALAAFWEAFWERR
jgi:hypothetical protein